MSQSTYLIITILVLAGLAILALVCFLYLYKGRKKEGAKKCSSCSESDCPLAAKLREREEE